MRTFVQCLLQWAFSYDPEMRRVVSIARGVAGEVGRPCRILDVGCGFGRYLRPLGALGYDCTGVDLNPEILAANRAANLHCCLPDELSREQRFDLILMAHVVAHIEPRTLLEVMDRYLDLLRPGGRLVICSPLFSPWFYEDFDIVKPYQPTGFLMVFGGQRSQVQYYARNRLELSSLWYRRGYFRCQHTPARYVRGWKSRMVLLADFASASLFRISLGILGRKDGWVGEFRKLEA